ncbi:hypothetical protein C0Q70_15558 [Pomacea canaliculata]|uniref:Uncharacterized protein n=1 Tax=Pomacea canaliculata TaxID=400727 RepID=A0A2T7NV59_POMCA|nr:hypothetical protein C0Q70_15558 [Pomacea canaliculata]
MSFGDGKENGGGRWGICVARDWYDPKVVNSRNEILTRGMRGIDQKEVPTSTEASELSFF